MSVMTVTVDEWDHVCDPVPAGVSVGRSRLAGTLLAECAVCGWRCAYWECACDLAHDCDGGAA